MERVRCARAVRRGIDKWIDDLQLLDDRAGPAVIDDERQRVFVLRPDVNEVDGEPVDLGGELRECVQLRLADAPVVVRHPVARELLDHGERHALGLIRDSLFLRPVRRPNASAEVVECLFGNVDVEGTDLCCGFDGCHVDLRLMDVGSTAQRHDRRFPGMRRRSNDSLRVPRYRSTRSLDRYKCTRVLLMMFMTSGGVDGRRGLTFAGVDTASAGYKINFLGCWAQSGRSTSTSRAAPVLATLRPMPFGAGVSLFVVDLTGSYPARRASPEPLPF